MYNSYSEALKSYIEGEFGRGGKKKLAKLLSDNPDDDSEVHSNQVQVGRWTNNNPEKRNEPLDHKKKEINKLLNIRIVENQPGEWVIKRTDNKNPQINGDKSIKSKESLDQLFEELKSRHSVFDIPDTPRGHVLRDIVNDVVSLFLKLDHLIQEERDRSQD